MTFLPRRFGAVGEAEARTLVGEGVVDILQQGEEPLGLRSRKGLSMELVLDLVPVAELELVLELVLELEKVLMIHTLLQILDTKRSQNIDPRLYHLPKARGNSK